MKIIKGTLKGRNIICPPHIRPVSLRVKKACFDILKGEIEGRRVLDLFAGSGSLGIEALSCGAKQAIFIDIEGECIETIKKNLTSLKLVLEAEVYPIRKIPCGLPQSKYFSTGAGFNSPEFSNGVYLKDVFRAVEDFAALGEKFDLIFLDPPYYKGMIKKFLQTLEEYDILTAPGFLIGFCYVKDDVLMDSNRFSLILEKKYGQNLLLIYRKK
ncbi:MAG: RsmD family RNA methyltransferase [Candidatus Omnitrophica bacterium]|nr:RsmD family RNA methyltransferase [Candidatus Omnitrophota bacterium]MBU0878653.1 RsmD family RNA methyltransferase [Candidatus Omnitrophota bacterium]MBU0897413.1 RsmD family RNA methyltransferase [Candidatus Omnitrophota bacterium]MBU1134181.1 RsmD family RNA methyltransferase [Candidatus Omnitrophota bacterium]MBU1366392.1 RsmD family RNA methyltransferase [Candidatus Omnitrophota bacterium]